MAPPVAQRLDSYDSAVYQLQSDVRQLRSRLGTPVPPPVVDHPSRPVASMRRTVPAEPATRGGGGGGKASSRPATRQAPPRTPAAAVGSTSAVAAGDGGGATFGAVRDALDALFEEHAAVMGDPGEEA
ncbi:hypothetical protein HK405_002210, partial [Cladochytrium tenue]